MKFRRTCLQVMRFLIWSHEDWAEVGGGGGGWEGGGFWCFFLRLVLMGFIFLLFSAFIAKEVESAMKVMKVSLFFSGRERERVIEGVK